MATTVRVPPRIEQALAEYCVSARRTKSEVIIELLEQRFIGTATENTPYELACEAGFIGCLDEPAKAAKATPAGSGKAKVADAIRAKHRRASHSAP